MSECFLGEIRMFAGNYAPQNWHMCDGSLLPINTYQALFTLIGTVYGGDAQTTFGLPDLRSRIPMGMGNGPSLTPRTLGQTGGAEMVTLDSTTIPAHNHALMASLTQASSLVPTNNVLAATAPGGSPNLSMYTINPPPTPAPTQVSLAPATVSAVGGSQPHPNMMAGLCLNFIIALFGIFPSQS